MSISRFRELSVYIIVWEILSYQVHPATQSGTPLLTLQCGVDAIDSLTNGGGEMFCVCEDDALFTVGYGGVSYEFACAKFPVVILAVTSTEMLEVENLGYPQPVYPPMPKSITQQRMAVAQHLNSTTISEEDWYERRSNITSVCGSFGVSYRIVSYRFERALLKGPIQDVYRCMYTLRYACHTSTYTYLYGYVYI